MMRILTAPLLLLSVLLLGGCASYVADHNRSLADVRHFFVQSNSNDNRALDRQIAAALRARGFQAEYGPLTMMSDEAQVIVTYQDHWTWDFGDHLVFLQISVRDRNPELIRTFATAKFSTRLPTRTPTSGIIDGLVARLLKDGGS
jgi:hypothetical protein